MAVWQVRQEGSPNLYRLPSAAEVLTGLRDGNFLPTDEVKGPDDTAWQPIELHSVFAEAALDIEPPPDETVDDTHLDMNPLIDVCLVLLIFFILTITYASLERAIGVPEDVPQDKGAVAVVPLKDIQDRIFIVIVTMDGERPVVKIGVRGSMKEIPTQRVFVEMQELINKTGRKEMLIDIDKNVPWGVETDILDAATGNKVHTILNNQRPRR